MRIDLLVHGASELATFRGAAGPRRGKRLGDVAAIRDGAVAIRDGVIVDVGPTRRLRGKYRSVRRIDAEQRLVTPGFVDPHTHLPFAGDRSFELALKLAGHSYLDIQRRGGGIRRTVQATRRASLHDLVRLTRSRAQTMLAWGTTTAEAKSGYGLAWRHERKQLHAIRRASDPRGLELVPTFLGAHVVPEDAPGGRKGWMRDLLDVMLPAVAADGLADFVDVFLDDGAYTRAEAAAILRRAEHLGLARKLHADEFTNKRGAQLAAETGATSCEHLLRVSPTGVRALAASSTVAVLLPGVAELGFLDHQAPARSLVDAGAAIALGTDFNPNCPVLTMPTILQWGVYALRLSPAEALAAATANAAHAIGRGAAVGRLQRGYQADLLIHEHETVDELAYWVGPNPVRTVVKRGVRIAS